ncbi:MAG: IucA/IucC family protein [Streptosporangiaceae bacterium]
MTEHELAARIVDALLRENYGGLAERVDGAVLRLPDGTSLPLEPDGFQADQRVRRGRLTVENALAILDAIADPRDTDGVAAFKTECRQALTELRLRAAHPATTGNYDAIAAALPHPVYPASPGHPGLSNQDLLRYAPEFSPEFELNWAAVPAERVTSTATRPAWWPSHSDVGLPDNNTRLLPVHPLTARDAWPGDGATLAPRTHLLVRPTLSLRTVVVTPNEHLKLPVPLATLGMRNFRSLAPRTLADGALVNQVLAKVTEDPELSALILADDTGYAHAGHPFLGYLHRRLPWGAEHAIPIAALAAPGLIAERESFLAEYFDLLFRVHVRLFSRYGIALEAHQQNAAIIPGEPMKLLVKDYDGTLINHARLTRALGADTPPPEAFADQRLLTDSDDALTAVMVTIVVHLCVGAIAVTPAERALARDALAAALDREPGAAPLRRALAADRLPVKAMVTAGTLIDKVRLGITDINKYYKTTGPNYLKEDSWTRGL